jgi:hypothetical protein
MHWPHGVYCLLAWHTLMQNIAMSICTAISSVIFRHSLQLSVIPDNFFLYTIYPSIQWLSSLYSVPGLKLWPLSACLTHCWILDCAQLHLPFRHSAHFCHLLISTHVEQYKVCFIIKVCFTYHKIEQLYNLVNFKRHIWLQTSIQSWYGKLLYCKPLVGV